MPELQEIGTIRIRALRGIPASAADSLHLVVISATEGQTNFASGLTAGTFEAKDVTLIIRNTPIPYTYVTVSDANVVYNASFAMIGALQDEDVVELRVWT